MTVASIKRRIESIKKQIKSIVIRLKYYDEAISWIFEHCTDITSYVYALKLIGYSKEQAIEEIDGCWYGEEDDGTLRAKAIREVYGED